jgi:hypothetical protein
MIRHLFLLLLWMLPSLGWADCQAYLNQALALLSATQNKIQKNEHPSPDAFALEFQKIVQTMQAEQCAPELKQLMEHIQQEQSKYPALPEGKPEAEPITD